MKRLRGAVIGCGMIAEFHLRAWARLPEVEIVALADPDPTAAERARTCFAPAARTYLDAAPLLATETLDFVDILSPPALHRAHCLLARAARVHIICQKPLCPDLAEARALVAGFAGYPKLFCVHENHVYRPWFQHVQALHRQGAFGRLQFVRLAQRDPAAPAQAFKRESSRGVLFEYGVHLADMVRSLLGLPAQVSAQLDWAHPDIRGESQARVAFIYPGAKAEIEIAWENGGTGSGEARFLGDSGEAVYQGTMTRGGSARFQVGANVAETRDTVADYVESFYSLQRDFVRAVLDGTLAPQPARENLQTLEMVFAAYAAAGRGKAVSFPSE